MVQKTLLALTNSLPPRKPELRSTWRMDLNVSHKNCGRKLKDRTRKRVTEINAILSSVPFRRNCQPWMLPQDDAGSGKAISPSPEKSDFRNVRGLNRTVYQAQCPNRSNMRLMRRSVMLRAVLIFCSVFLLYVRVLPQTALPISNQFVIARHTFFDFGPPFDFYELFIASPAVSGTSIERITVTP